jgi:hypothetical protein
VTLRVLVVAEDVLGMTLARDLCDRVVIERGPTWLADLWHDVVTRDSQRQWSGLDASTGYVTWSGMKDLAQRLGLRTHGLGMSGGAFEAYRTAHAAAMLTPRPDVLVMCRDTDRTPSLRADMLSGVERARVEDVPMLLAVARPESEAWVIAGFEPSAAHEREARMTLAQTLGFDPVEEPHKMTANTGDARDAKRCCSVLLPRGVHAPRGECCWRETSLDDLTRRGASTGLPEYIADVETTLLPRLAGAQIRHR